MEKQNQQFYQQQHLKTLSQAIAKQQNPLQNETLLALNGKNIDIVDQVAPQFQQITDLDLNNNNLESLKGIEQFQNLQVLHLEGNKICDFNCLFHLKYIPTIRDLVLKGNPVDQAPNYQNIILTVLPELKKLDGNKIQKADKEKILNELSSQFDKLENLLLNYCDLIVLQSVIRKLDIHTELCSVYNIDIKTQPFDLQKFMQSFNYQQFYLDENLQNEFKMNLLQDVHTIQQDVLKGQDIEQAFDDLLEKQLIKLNELSHLIKQKVNQYKNIRLKQQIDSQYNAESYNKKQREQYKEVYQQQQQSQQQQQIQQQQQQYLLPNSSKYSPPHSKINESAEFYQDQQESSIEMKSEGNVQKSVQFSPQKSNTNINSAEKIQSGKKLYSPQQQHSNRNMNSSYHTNPNNSSYINIQNEQQSEVIVFSQQKKSPSKQKSKSPIKMSTMKNYQQENIQSLKKLQKMPPHLGFNTAAMKAHEKDRLIEELASNLKNKIQELIFEKENIQKLKHKIDEFKHQNVENIRFAEDQIKAKQNKIEMHQEKERVLELEFRELKDQLNSFQMKQFHLEKYKDDLQRAESEINAYKVYIQKVAHQEKQEEMALEFYYRKLQKHFFFVLKFGTFKQKQIAQFTEKMRLKNMERHVAISFAYWQQYVILQKIINQKQKEQELKIQNWALDTWRQNLVQVKIKNENKKNQYKRLTLLMFCEWKDFMKISRRRKYLKNQANLMRKRHLQKKAFQSLFQWKVLYRMDEYQEQQLEKYTTETMNLRKQDLVYQFWKSWVFEHRIPKKQKIKEVKQEYLQKLRVKSFQRWKTIIQQSIINNKRADTFRRNKIRELQSNILYYYKVVQHQRVVRQNREKQQIENLIQKRNYYRWVKKYQEIQKEKQMCIQMDTKCNLLLQKKGFATLRKYWSRKKSNRKKVANFAERLVQLETQFFFNTLKLGIKIDKEEYVQQKRMEAHFLKKYLGALQLNNKRRKKKKINNENCDTYVYNKKIELQKNILKFWGQKAQRKKRNKEIIKKRQEKQYNFIYKTGFFALALASREKLKEDLYKQMQLNLDLSGNYEILEDQSQNLEKEKIQFLQQIKELENQVSELNQIGEDRDYFIADLKEKYSKLQISEDKLQTEILIKCEEIKEIQDKLNNNTNDFEKKSQKYENNIKEMQLNIEDLSNEISQLQETIQINENNFNNHSQEQNEKIEQQENIIQDLQNEIEQNGQETNLIKQRNINLEQENLDLMKLMQKTEAERDETKQKLKECLELLEESQESYEKLTSEKQQQVYQLKSENEDKEIKIEQQEKQIIELRSELKKYQLEVQMMAEAQHNDTEEFIQNLNNQRVLFNKNVEQKCHSQQQSLDSKQFQNESSVTTNDNQNYNYNQNQNQNITHIRNDSDFLTNKKQKQQLQSPQSKQKQIKEFIKPNNENKGSPVKQYLLGVQQRENYEEYYKNLTSTVQLKNQIIQEQTKRENMQQSQCSYQSASQSQTDIKFNNQQQQQQFQQEGFNQTGKKIQNISDLNTTLDKKQPGRIKKTDSAKKLPKDIEQREKELVKLNIQQRIKNLNSNFDSDIFRFKETTFKK